MGLRKLQIQGPQKGIVLGTLETLPSNEKLTLREGQAYAYPSLLGTCLLGPPPMANGKPGDPKSAPNWNPPTYSLHRGPPGLGGPMIPPLLSLPPPPRGRGPIRGGLGPRCGPYGRGWWGANTEPPFPGPGHGSPSRRGFHKEQRNPQRLKSWSLIKNTCPPKDGPQVMEDKSNRPVCRHFAKKGHCRYEDLCAFYHPGANGPPL
ncbi:proline-rich protein 3-like [Vulpes lagopus]|uniref:proline-rich protein 3-like n=1 Tax=Vulpes lagopus TaxID=494514 RepID=UPI001BC97E51|nr:proline-rich protein 3-like [Vulpes lagopus]